LIIMDRQTEEKNDIRGSVTSVAVHSLLMLLIWLMPNVEIPPPPSDSIIQVELPSKDLLGGGPALGLKNQGQGTKASAGKPDPDAGNAPPEPTPAPEKPAEVPKPTPAKPVIATKPTPAPTPPVKKVETEDPNAVAIRHQQEEAKRKAEEQKYQKEAADRAKRQQEAAAAAETAAAAEKAAAQKAANDKFKGRFGKNGTGSGSGTNGGGGTGDGRGNTGKPGNQGAPDGDPNSSVLTGVGKGAGVVNGFGGRGVRSAPKLLEQSQKSGKVVLDVCIDGDGTVLSARFNSRLSNTPDPELQQAAINNANQYKFASGGVDKQCGTITYNFIVK
jgi:outer membrane biosynthesis protein TonB